MACNGDDSSSGDGECTLGGKYDVVLSERNGDCGPQSEPPTITVPELDTLAGQTEMRDGHQITSAFWFKGCSLRLRQDVVSDEGLIASSLDTDELRLVSQGVMQGEASLRRYTATMPQTVACEGSYDMTMRLRQ